MVAIFTDRLRAGERVTIFGDGEQTRDYVYVGDVVAAVLAAAGRDGGVFNVGTGAETSVNELFEACRRVAGVETEADARPRASRGRPPQRARRLPGGARARLAAADAARGGAAADVGLRPAATFIAIRAAFWLGAAATLIWAPAPERRLIGDAYGPAHRLPLPGALAVGRTLVPPDLAARLRGGAAGGRLLPRLPGGRPLAHLGDRLGARRGRADLTRRRRRRGLGAGAARAAAARRARRARRGALLRALPRRLRLHLPLLGGALHRARRRLVPRRDAGPPGARRRARRPRDRDAADGARAPAGARAPTLARARPALARAARAAAAPAGRRRPVRALPRLGDRRRLGVHERPGRLEPRRLAARPARGAQGRRPVRGPRPAPPVRHARRRAGERAARRPLEPLPPGAARRRRSG